MSTIIEVGNINLDNIFYFEKIDLKELDKNIENMKDEKLKLILKAEKKNILEYQKLINNCKKTKTISVPLIGRLYQEYKRHCEGTARIFKLKKSEENKILKKMLGVKKLFNYWRSRHMFLYSLEFMKQGLKNTYPALSKEYFKDSDEISKKIKIEGKEYTIVNETNPSLVYKEHFYGVSTYQEIQKMLPEFEDFLKKRRFYFKQLEKYIINLKHELEFNHKPPFDYETVGVFEYDSREKEKENNEILLVKLIMQEIQRPIYDGLKKLEKNEIIIWFHDI